jgi:hypothetical protein
LVEDRAKTDANADIDGQAHLVVSYMFLFIFKNDLLVSTMSFIDKLACSLLLNEAPSYIMEHILKQTLSLVVCFTYGSFFFIIWFRAIWCPCRNSTYHVLHLNYLYVLVRMSIASAAIFLLAFEPSTLMEGERIK